MKRNIANALAALTLSMTPVFAQEQTAAPYLQDAQTTAQSQFAYIPASALRVMSHQQCLNAGKQADAGGAVYGAPFVYLPEITSPQGAKPGDELAVQMEGVVRFELASPYVPAQAHRVVIDTIRLAKITDADG